MPRTKANPAAIRAALDAGAPLEEAIAAGFADDPAELVASGAAGLPLTARDATWSASDAETTIRKWASSDGSGDLDKVDWGRYGQAFFWHDDDPQGVGDFKLGFAQNDNGLQAVWAGVTACAAVLQGSRGGVQGISADDRSAIQGKIGAYYAAARKKYDDDTIRPPWDDAGENCADNVAALALVESMSDEEFGTFAGKASMHDFRGDQGEDCAICGKPYDDPIHYGHEDDAAAKAGQLATAPADAPPAQDAPPAGQGEDPAQPHSFKPADGNPAQCAVCGQMEDDPIHDVSDYGIVLSDGRRLVGLYAIAPGAAAWVRVDDGEAPEQEQGDSPPAPVAPATGGAAFSAVLAIEGTPTDDGRMIEEGALEWRELPLTLMAMIEEPEMGGHGGAQVAGRIDTITRQDNQIIGSGSFDTGEFGAEIARLVGEKTLRGVSVDLAIKEYEERWGDDVEGGTTDPLFGESFLFVVKQAVIMGATVCPFPAFAEADIQIAAAGKPIVQHVKEADGYATALTVLGEFQPTDAPDVPTPPGGGSLMIALFPTADQATAIADPDGNVPAEQLHVTLFSGVSGDADAVTSLVDDFAGGYAALSGTVGGAGMFGGETPGDEGEPAETAPDADEGDGGDGAADADQPQVLIVDAPGLGELRFDLADALEAAGMSYAEDHDFTPHITTDYDDSADLEHNFGLIGTALDFAAISIVQSDGTRQDVPLTTGMTASAAGLIDGAPPSAWFDYPIDVVGRDEIVPFTVTADGRVYGHVALFNECHIGSPKGRCITAPHHYQADPDDPTCLVCGARGAAGHSQTWYDYFHLGQVETADGELVNVGQITLGTGHAPTSGLSPKAAAAHYDNTGTATADVRCYENRMGVVVAGALRPEAPAAKVRELRAAKISGDWRSIRGHHELVGLLAVNVPGFPIPRASRGVDAEQQREVALVAAGLVPDEPTEATIEYLQRREQMAAMVRQERMRTLLRHARR